MASKKIDQRNHAKKRAFERYGLELNSQQYKEMCNILSSGKGKFILRQSNRRSIVSFNYNNKNYYVAYDKNRKQIATFLTQKMICDLIKETKE